MRSRPGVPRLVAVHWLRSYRIVTYLTCSSCGANDWPNRPYGR
jgi:hypothetical protein